MNHGGKNYLFYFGAECSLVRETISGKLQGKRLYENVNMVGLGQHVVSGNSQILSVAKITDVLLEINFHVLSDSSLCYDIIIGRDILNQGVCLHIEFCRHNNEADDGVMELVPYGFNSDSDESLDLHSKSQTRKRRRKVVNRVWFAAKNKKLRANGKIYLEKKGENGVWNHRRVRNAKVIGERCRCKKATGFATLHCAEVTVDQRQVIFKEFWQMDWIGH